MFNEQTFESPSHQGLCSHQGTIVWREMVLASCSTDMPGPSSCLALALALTIMSAASAEAAS